MNILDELRWRKLYQDCTDVPIEYKMSIIEKSGELEMTEEGGVEWERYQGILTREGITLYCGFDPTADSLHVGNLVPLLTLRRFQLFGHHPIAVAGGATGSIGDPSGKTQERQLLSPQELHRNITCVKEQLKKLLDFKTTIQNPARLVDNAEWTRDIRLLDFLRDVGKHFTVNQMIAKESVRARMEDREAGISYTEFSYMLLQAMDFYFLCKDHNCLLQIGGSDQWGNITSGIELCRKKLGVQVFGLTLPLITNADGSKFGKTEAGAVWLDPKRTSIYRFYQFWINTSDADVIRYLKFFTFLSQEEIAKLEKSHSENPGAREAHQKLAQEVTKLIHGELPTANVMIASDVLFGKEIDPTKQDSEYLKLIVGEVPTTDIKKTQFDGAGMPLAELLVHSGLCSSKGQARKDIEGGGIYVNNFRESNSQRMVSIRDLLNGELVLLRKGKKNYAAITAK